MKKLVCFSRAWYGPSWHRRFRTWLLSADTGRMYKTNNRMVMLTVLGLQLYTEWT